MSDAKQPEQMRPIPDGGLKDAMPSWLKRPPAWRDLPNAEQRHEQRLPEPDTSEIDPRSLVDVSDLPQWLQAIAARGDIPVPTPDASVGHAVEVVQAAHHPAARATVNVGPGISPGHEQPIPDTVSQVPIPRHEPPAPDTVGPGVIPGHEGTSDTQTSPMTTTVPTRTGYPAWIWPVAALVIVVLVLTLYILG